MKPKGKEAWLPTIMVTGSGLATGSTGIDIRFVTWFWAWVLNPRAFRKSGWQNVFISPCGNVPLAEMWLHTFGYLGASPKLFRLLD